MRKKIEEKKESVYRVYLNLEEMDGPLVVNEGEEKIGYNSYADSVFPPEIYWETEIEADLVRERMFNWLLRKYAHNPCEDCPIDPELMGKVPEAKRKIVFERLWEWLVNRWREVEQEKFLK